MKKKILYVEDNEDTANAVKLILEHAGFEVETVSNGKQGIKKATGTDFDLILLDVMLPDMSGWDIFAKLKKKVKSKFAFLSAIPVSSERKEELKQAGISDYITKPFTKSDLLEKINAMLRE